MRVLAAKDESNFTGVGAVKSSFIWNEAQTGSKFAKAGKWSGATLEFRAAIETDPRYAEAYYGLSASVILLPTVNGRKSAPCCRNDVLAARSGLAPLSALERSVIQLKRRK